MNNILLILLLCGSGFGYDKFHEVDMIELNHYYNDSADPDKLTFVQVIYWEWSPDYHRFHVVSWSMVQPQNGMAGPMPEKRGNYWHHRNIKSKILKKSWTKYDPERENKHLFPDEFRIKLETRQAL